MAVALTPNAFLVRNTVGAPSSFSVCGWTRIDTDRNQFTIVRYWAANSVGGGGFQATVDADLKLILFECTDFEDILGGTGPTLSVGVWYFMGLTTIVDDIPDNVEFYLAAEGDASLSATTCSYPGAYQYANHYIGARPGADGGGGAFRLNGSVEHDRVWHSVTLTPSEMLAEYESATAVKAGAWAVWPLTDAATAIQDATANNRDLTQTTGTGSVTTTTGPSFGSPVGALSETDALTPVSRSAARTVGVLTEADVLSAATRSASAAVGAFTETDALLAPGRSSSVQAAALAEVDGAVAAARSVSRSGGLLTEVDALATATRSHNATLAALAEIDSLAASARSSSHQPGVLAETDALLEIGETSEAGTIAETDTLSPAGHTTILAVAALAELDVLSPADRSAAHPVSQITEVEAVAAAARTTSRTLGLLGEIDVLVPAGEVEEVGALFETDTLLAVGRSTARLAAVVGEIDTLLPVGHVSARAAGLMAEVDVLAAVGEEVLGRLSFVTRTRPLVSATTTAAPTVDMEVST